MNRILTLLLFSFSFTTAHSQAGQPDPLFGNGGVVQSNLFFYGGASGGVKTFLQPDGTYRLVLKEGSRMTVTRVLIDGTHFPFQPDTTSNESINMKYGDATIDTEGRIVLAGSQAVDGNEDFRVIVITAEGWIYGNYTLADFGSNTDVATAVAVQPDGRLVVAGYSVQNGLAHFAVVRYLTNGQLDPSFSGDGRQITSIGNNGAYATGIAIQDDGKIVVAGHAGGSGGRRDFAVVRYNTNGSRDLSFSKDGKQLTSVGAYDDVCTALAIQTDGKIVLTGSTQSGGSASNNYKFATIRYKGDGTLDPGFNGTGMVVTTVGGLRDKATTIALQPDGKILVAGKAENVNGLDFGIVRYTAAGTLDAAFNGAGMKTVDFSNGKDSLQAMMLQPDGKIVLTGSTNAKGNNLEEVALVRLSATGQLDADFSGDGKGTYYSSLGSTRYSGLLVQPDGKIVAGGGARHRVWYLESARFALARYHPNGSFDSSFGDGGKQTTNIPGFGADISSMALQSDGKIVCGGSFYNTVETGQGVDFILARYTASGGLDSSFGSDGLVYTGFESESDDELSAVLIQPDGRIVAVGYRGGTSESFIAIARYNTDGSPDASFSEDGKHTVKVTIMVDEQEEQETEIQVTGVALQPDGKLVIAGNLPLLYLEGGIVLLRILPDGSLDPGFGENGKVITLFGGSSDGHRATTVALQPDGKILVGGASDGNLAISRYTSNGDLDITYGENGKQRTDFLVTVLAIQEDGKLIAGGNGVMLARHKIDGTLDISFSEDGKQVLETEKGVNEISGLAIGKDRLYVTATTAYNTEDDKSDNEYYLGLVAAFQLGGPEDPVTKAIKVNLYGGSNPYSNTAWNNWNALRNLHTSFLKYSDGTASPVKAVMSNRSGVNDNGASYGSGMAPAEVLRHSCYSTGPRTITLSGLSLNKTYSLELYASRANTGQSTLFTINGTATPVVTDGNKTVAATFANLSPNASGQIVLSLSSVNMYNYLNGFVLTETQGAGTLAAPLAATIINEEVDLKEEADLHVSAYPNPTSNYFTLQVSSNTGEEVVIQLMDVLGKLIEVRKVTLVKGSTVRIGHDLRPGIYYATVTQSTKRKSIKLVKR